MSRGGCWPAPILGMTPGRGGGRMEGGKGGQRPGGNQPGRTKALRAVWDVTRGEAMGVPYMFTAEVERCLGGLDW